MQISKRVLAAEPFFSTVTLELAMHALYQFAVDNEIMLIGCPGPVRVDGCAHVLRMVEATLENGTMQFNLEIA